MEGERHALEIAAAATEELVRKVEAPPPRTSLEKMKSRAKETFFPDDPFRHFKGQPSRRKCVLAARYLFPVLEWLPYYSFSFFKSDLVAGLTIASLAIPQASTHAGTKN